MLANGVRSYLHVAHIVVSECVVIEPAHALFACDCYKILLPFGVDVAPALQYLDRL